jgi:hypothetical protein
MPDFIPLHANVHFKCAFDISAPKVPKIMTHLRQKFRSWCINKVGSNDQTLHRSWFYIGNNPKVEPAQYIIDDYQLRTIAAPGDDPDEPSCWAFEMIHPDSNERSRRWSVEITLRQNEDKTVRFTTVVQNWMMQNYIGEYPTPPSASAPSYVRSLLDDPALTCRKGDVVLKAQPINVTNKSCQAVYDQLLSANRQAPLIFIAHSPETKSVLVTPARFAAALIGNANVFVFSTMSVVDEMNYYLGNVLRCEYGSVRIYQPYIEKLDPANARLHRYLSASYIAQHGEDAILRFVTNGIARNGASFRLTDFTSFTDIFTERRRHVIKKLANESQGKSEEAALVWEENEKLITEVSNWQSMAIQYESENTTLNSQNAGLRYRIEEADRVRHRIKDLESQVEGMKQLTTLPSSLLDVLGTVAKLFPERIEIAENALKTAKEYADEQSGFWSRPEQLAIAWEMVFGMATRLHDLIFVDESTSLEDDFGQSFSTFELAMSEGKQTKKDARLMGLRKIAHDGQEIDITMHIKYGNKKPKMLRLHFAIKREGKKLIVGHFGDHMENYSTRKKG